jgi:hypothetical protein
MRSATRSEAVALVPVGHDCSVVDCPRLRSGAEARQREHWAKIYEGERLTGYPDQRQLQTSPQGAETGLVAYDHFDDGLGTTAKDSSAKHHDAALATDGGRPAPTWVDSSDLMLTCAP